LVVDTAAGLRDVAEWDRDDVDNASTDPTEDVTNALVAQAQEYTDGEDTKCKITIRWIGSKDRPLKGISHHCTPSPKTDDADAGSISDATIIRELLDALKAKDAALNKNLEAVGDATSSVIAMLTAQVEKLTKQNSELVDRASDTPEVIVAELTNEQREESAIRTRALNMLTDRGPEIFELLTAIAANKFLPDAEANTVKATVKAVTDITTKKK
jgi:hypothetical protein